MKYYRQLHPDFEWLFDYASEAVIQRGKNYFFQNRVTEIHYEENLYQALVKGTSSYIAVLYLDKKSGGCSCPAPYPCKHLIATALTISADPSLPHGPEIEQSAEKNSSPTEELIVVIKENGACKLMKREVESGKIDNIRPPYHSLLLPDKTVLDASSVISLFSYFNSFPFSELQKKRAFKELPRYFQDNIPIQKTVKVDLKARLIQAPPEEQIPGQESDFSNEPEFHIEYYYISPINSQEKIFKVPSGVDLSFTPGSLFPVYSKNPNKPEKTIESYIHYTIFPRERSLYRFSRFQPEHLTLSQEELLFYYDTLSSYEVESLQESLPTLYKHGPVALFSIYPVESKRLKIRGKWEFLYSLKKETLEDEKKFSRAISAKNPAAHFARFPLVLQRAWMGYEFEKCPRGNHAKINHHVEKSIYDSLVKTPWLNATKPEKTFFKKEILPFIHEGVDELEKLGVKIQIHKSLAKLLSKESHFALSFQIEKKSEIDWFEGKIEAAGMNLQELKKALSAYRKKEEFIQLTDGAWVSLERLGIEKLMLSFEKLGIKVSSGGDVKKMTQGEALAATIELQSQTRTETAVSGLLERIESLSTPEKAAEEKFTTLFQGKLRDYQKEGILFLDSLYKAGLGGILADDMGLGKTIQGLAFLSRLQQAKKKKRQKMLALVAGPLASVSVWKSECEKYFPDLKINLWHGAGRDHENFPSEGVVLTTYGTLLRDFLKWQDKIHFDVVLLDEAQNLKNFRSMSSHAVRKLGASVYFCLSGTPLENHLGDLWSLFDIIFPGYLGAHKSFTKHYQDAPLEDLKRKIAPFILRRTKGEVLKELPPLSEISTPVAMTKRQKDFYESSRQEALMELAMAGQDYLMVMLPHLTRLRRIACHPEIGSPQDAKIENSGKFQYLKETLPELEETSSGVLIFSQFTDVLKICSRLLDEMGYEHFYLDGKTTAKKREKIVEKFQAGEKSFFLISLKAGGTALTLHRADTVIHLDPWWNPAAERQASDRAHRIGQKKRVFVYKLYSEQSIEEKVLELQKKKQEIFNSLFGESVKSTGKITREQLMNLLSD